MSKGFSREDDLIKKLKNCLGTLPDQQDNIKQTKQSQPLKYRFEHEYLSQQIKQPYKANGRRFLDNKQQFIQSHNKGKSNKRNRNQLQICIEDKYKKRNSYYEQKTPLADISNKQYSFNNIRRHEQAYSKNRPISKNRATYNITFDHVYQQRGKQQRKYSTARTPNNENTKQAYIKNHENQDLKLQPSSQKQNSCYVYQTYKARPCYEKLQKQLSKQPLRLNEQNIGSIRRKRRQSGKITDQLYNENESQFSQSKSSLQSSKIQSRFEQDKTVENQLKNFFCKNCQNNDNIRNKKVQRNKQKEVDLNQQEEPTRTAEKLKKISQLNDRINEKIANIVATFQNSTETLYNKLYSKQ